MEYITGSNNTQSNQIQPVSTIQNGRTQQVVLVKEQFDKDKFNQTVNTQFTQLGVEEPDLSFFDPNFSTDRDWETGCI